MNEQNYTTSFMVNQTPEEVYKAINNVSAWWTGENSGNNTKEGNEFTHEYGDSHKARLKVVELTPYTKIIWLVVHNYFDFVKDKNEWTGTKIVFEIDKKDKETEVRFTHDGLVRNLECFGVCTDAWTSLIQGNLKNLITKNSTK